MITTHPRLNHSIPTIPEDCKKIDKFASQWINYTKKLKSNGKQKVGGEIENSKFLSYSLPMCGKFQAQDSQVMFSNLPHSHSLNCMDRETLERQVTLEEIKEAVWDCGSSQSAGPDGLHLLRCEESIGGHS
ncbi:hypothetical protein Tco_0493066 [Tanacetum coccineum]